MKFVISLMLGFAILFSNDVSEFDDEFSDKTEIFDPLSGYNRAMTGVNDFLYENLLNPAIKGYKFIVPKPAREAANNFFDNLMFPVRFVNNLLQFKFKAAGEETLRFVANTIIGFGGLTDGAKYYDLKRHDEDFGQTLGYWGVGSGFHIVLPILGPSNLRDIFGMSGDYFLNPITYVEPHNSLSWRIYIFKKINDFSFSHEAYDNIKKDAIDLYPLLRDSYEQHRNYLIKE